MTVTHNLSALSTHLNMKKADRLLAAATRRLSTGFRINSAKDDAAGLAIANKLAYQVAGLNRASENSSHGVSMVQTAEGALNEVHNMLQRMRELAVQASNDSNLPEDRVKIQTEIDELIDEINLTANKTEFNKIKVLNGEADRVKSSYYVNSGTGMRELDKTKATILYTTENVPGGTLEYTIDRPGLPAVVMGRAAAPPYTNDNDLVPASGLGKFNINNMEIEVKDGDSYGDVLTKINEVCGYADVTPYKDTNGTICLISNVAGSDQTISVSGDNTLLLAFGLTDTGGERSGTDAMITDVELTAESGGTDNAFNISTTVTADGNQVRITAPNGQEVRLNIQVAVDSSAFPPAFAFGDGDADKMQISIDPIDGHIIFTDVVGVNGYEILYPDGVKMQADIEEYGPIKLQIGPNTNMAMDVQIPKLNAETLGLVEYKNGRMYGILNYQTVPGSQQALGIVDKAIQTVSSARSRLGAYQNRMEATIRSLDTAAENTETSRSRIQDTDIAKETTDYARHNVMYQAGMAVLGQANQRPQQIISLLQ